jgi:hypothetical protein
VSGLVEFLRARYTEAREAETRKVSIPGNLPFRWKAVYEKDDPYVLIGDFHQVGMDEFFEKYGESAAHPDVLADLDAKLAVLKVYEDAELSLAAAGPGTPPHDLMTGAVNTLYAALRLLALPFAAHEDYDERWRP